MVFLRRNNFCAMPRLRTTSVITLFLVILPLATSTLEVNPRLETDLDGAPTGPGRSSAAGGKDPPEGSLIPAVASCCSEGRNTSGGWSGSLRIKRGAEAAVPELNGDKPGKETDKFMNTMLEVLSDEAPRKKFEERQKETASLVFVFDTTGSMSDDLFQARNGAKEILKVFIEQEIIPVSNYILVPFNDPDVQSITITENPDAFVKALDKLTTDGGGDCPEMACGGILKALQVAHPYSYLYVFTDAPAKDYHLYNNILEAIQRKHSQVSFFLSGLCSYVHPQGKDVYTYIASASNGQVFSVTKHDIEAMLNSVRDTLRAEEETIFSVNRLTPITKEPHSENFNVTVEINLEEFIVTLTGYKPVIVVINPLGELIRNLKIILQLPNVMVVSVLHPKPAGVWNVHVTIQPKKEPLKQIPDGFALQVRGTGVTYKIHQGFSLQVPHGLQETAQRPLEGTENYLLITITPVQNNEENKAWLEKYKWETVEFRKLDGEIYFSQPLKAVTGKEYNETEMIFLAGPLNIPFGLFTLLFNGFDGDGNPVSRISRNAISSAPVSPPLVTMKEELIGLGGKPLTIHCEVESMLPFVLDWYKNGQVYHGNLSYVQSHDAELTIPTVEKEDQGLYTCRATNTKGSTMSPKGTSVTVVEPPVIVKMRASKYEILENHTVLLDCVVKSDVNHTVQWTLNHEGKLVHLSKEHLNDRFHLLSNNSLLIKSFQYSDSGLYTCSAENIAGVVPKQVELLLVLPPKIVTAIEEFYYTEGDNIDLECKVIGKVGANISWIFNGESLPHLSKSSTKFAHNIVIPKPSKQWEGKYICIAANEAGKSQKEVKAIYWEPPNVKPLTNQYMSFKSGELAVMTCSVSGIPPPNVRWLHNEQPIKNNQYYEISLDGFTLKVHGFNAETEGFYICEAHSILNTTSRTYFKLLLGAPPKPSKSPNDASINLGEEEWLNCDAENQVDVNNFPQMVAQTSWRRENNVPIDLMRHEVLASGTLHIIDFKRSDAGIYVCTLENSYGKVDLKVKLQLIGSPNSAIPGHIIFTTQSIIALNLILCHNLYMLSSSFFL